MQLDNLCVTLRNAVISPASERPDFSCDFQ